MQRRSGFGSGWRASHSQHIRDRAIVGHRRPYAIRGAMSAATGVDDSSGRAADGSVSLPAC